MSIDQYRREILKQGDKPKAAKRNKFNAQKVEMDGMTFDSKKEHKRYIELKAMQQRGEIFSLEHHTKFELAPKTKLEGEKRQSQHYVILLISLTTSSQVNTLSKM